MRNKIRAILLQAHSSLICGIDSDKASSYLEVYIKSELNQLLTSAEDLLLTNKIDKQILDDFILDQRNKYKL